MSNLALIAGIPEVRSAVLGDLAGGFYDAVEEADGETVAAVMGFLSSALVQAGEGLGLGALRRTTVAGATQAHVVVLRDGSVITACVEPPGALATVEKALDTTLQGRG
jgi:hypothetical protein